MSRIDYAERVRDDLKRISLHLAAYEVGSLETRIVAILRTIHVLEHSPSIGRPVNANLRELIIGRDSRGYVALYRYDPHGDVVSVLAIRAQREAGYAQFD